MLGIFQGKAGLFDLFGLDELHYGDLICMHPILASESISSHIKENWQHIANSALGSYFSGHSVVVATRGLVAQFTKPTGGEP